VSNSGILQGVTKRILSAGADNSGEILVYQFWNEEKHCSTDRQQQTIKFVIQEGAGADNSGEILVYQFWNEEKHCSTDRQQQTIKFVIQEGQGPMIVISFKKESE